jgi:hypothetical protein
MSHRCLRRLAVLLAPLLFWSTDALAGLDVTAYGKLVPLKSMRVDDPAVADKPGLVALQAGEMPERFEGLREGVYRFRKSFDFRAGSYSGYNGWRNELAKLAGNPPSPYTLDGKTEPRYDATVWKRKSGPFWELIAFSDAEGVIGPVVCKRVHADFVRFAAAAARHPDPGFRASYEDWKTAFAMCAQGGAIVFH